MIGGRKQKTAWQELFKSYNIEQLDEAREGEKPDFTTLANELQKMLIFEVLSTVTIDSDKSNVLTT